MNHLNLFSLPAHIMMLNQDVGVLLQCTGHSFTDSFHQVSLMGFNT